MCQTEIFPVDLQLWWGLIEENVSAISNINGKTLALISLCGSKSKSFFLDRAFRSNVQQSYREKFFVEGGRDTNFSADCSLDRAQSDADMRNVLLCVERGAAWVTDLSLC